MGVMHTKLLIDALQVLRIKHGQHAWTMISRMSGIHRTGVARIANGGQEPTPDTWLKMHAAFPDEIPPPTLQDNVFTNKKSSEKYYNNIHAADQNGLIVISGVFKMFPKIRHYLKLLINTVHNKDYELSIKVIQGLKKEALPEKISEKTEIEMQIPNEVLNSFPRLKYYIENLNTISNTGSRELFQDTINKLAQDGYQQVMEQKKR